MKKKLTYPETLAALFDGKKVKFGFLRFKVKNNQIYIKNPLSYIKGWRKLKNSFRKYKNESFVIFGQKDKGKKT